MEIFDELIRECEPNDFNLDSYLCGEFEAMANLKDAKAFTTKNNDDYSEVAEHFEKLVNIGQTHAN